MTASCEWRWYGAGITCTAMRSDGSGVTWIPNPPRRPTEIAIAHASATSAAYSARLQRGATSTAGICSPAPRSHSRPSMLSITRMLAIRAAIDRLVRTSAIVRASGLN